MHTVYIVSLSIKLMAHPCSLSVITDWYSFGIWRNDSLFRSCNWSVAATEITIAVITRHFEIDLNPIRPLAALWCSSYCRLIDDTRLQIESNRRSNVKWPKAVSSPHSCTLLPYMIAVDIWAKWRSSGRVALLDRLWPISPARA